MLGIVHTCMTSFLSCPFALCRVLLVRAYLRRMHLVECVVVVDRRSLVLDSKSRLWRKRQSPIGTRSYVLWASRG